MATNNELESLYRFRRDWKPEGVYVEKARSSIVHGPH